MSNAELEQLYDEHVSALFAFVVNLTRNESIAHEVLQEVFIRLAQSDLAPAILREPRSYLLKIAHRLVIDRSRREQARDRKHENFAHEITLLFEAFAPDEEVLSKALSEALLKLPSEQREVVHLRLWEGLAFERIAEILSISPNTAASRYRYSLDKLRALLRPLYDEIK